MTEMVVPGTYIQVRTEGLISAGRVATGIVGVVGTAANGPIGTPVTLSGFADARERFGFPDVFNRPEDGEHPLTLVRALEHIYNNGAASVVAVRVAGSNRSSASYAVQDADRRTVALLSARTPGTWGNNIRIQSDEAQDPCRVEDELHTDSFDELNYAPIRPSRENRILLTSGATRQPKPLNIVYRRIVRDEEATRRDNRIYLTAVDEGEDRPAVEVPAVNLIRVLDADGTQVRQYGDGDIVYGSGSPPDEDAVRIVNDTGELIFAADQKPEPTQPVVATYALGHPAPQPGEVLLTVWDGGLEYATGQAPDQTADDTLSASYLVEPEVCTRVRLTHGATTEQYTVPDGNMLAQARGSGVIPGG